MEYVTMIVKSVLSQSRNSSGSNRTNVFETAVTHTSRMVMKQMLPDLKYTVCYKPS